MRVITRKLDGVFVGCPIKYDGKVVGKVMSICGDECTMVIEGDNADMIKRLITNNKSYSIEVRAANEEIR